MSNPDNDVNVSKPTFVEENVFCVSYNLKYDKMVAELDNILPFIPRVLLMLLLDYVITYDVYFSPRTEKVLSNNNKTLTISNDELGDRDNTVFMIQHPLSLISSKWSFRIDDQPLGYRSCPVTFGIMRKKEKSCLYGDYQEIRSKTPGMVYFRDPYKDHVYSNDKEIFHKAGTIISFETDLEHGTVSVGIDGIVVKDVFKEITDLHEWSPFIDIWTWKMPIVITVLSG